MPGHPASWSSSNSAGAGRRSRGHHTRTRGKISLPKGSKSCSCYWHWAPTELRTQHDQGARALKQFLTPTEYVFQWEEHAILRGNCFPLEDVSPSSCPAQKHIHGDAKSQSYQCYRLDFALPACSDWAKGRDCLNSKLQATSCSAWHFGGRCTTVNFQDPANSLVFTAAKGWALIYSYRSSPSPASFKIHTVLRCVRLLDSVTLLLKGKAVGVCCVTWSIVIPCNVIVDVNPQEGFVYTQHTTFFLDDWKSY